MSSVGLQFPIEQARCRKALEEYVKLGPQGVFAAAWTRAVLQQAEKAMASGDIIDIVRAFKSMQEIKL